DALERQRRSELSLRNRLAGLPHDPVPTDLPPIVGESQVVLESPGDVARRMLALFAIAVRGESLAGPQPIDLTRINDRMPLAVESLTADEAELLQRDGLPLDAVDAMAWRYETVLALQWALVMQPELPWPDERCDLATVSRLMLDLPHVDVIEHARLRPVDQLLDEADFHLRALWSIAAAQMRGEPIENTLDPGIVSERWLALSWCCRLHDSQQATAGERFAMTEAWIDSGMQSSG
ncbi:MAG: DUF4272 domain-containing protein, partial [Planctomycetota bacterium]